MSWPNPFRKRDGNTCTAWGYTFQVTSQHLTKEDTAAMKMSYDRLGEAALDRLNILCPSAPEIRSQEKVEPPKSSGAASDQPTAVSRVHKRDLFILLRDHALKDEGATRVVETLSRTGGFSTSVARHRLFETTQHILQCTKDLQSIQPGGAGHASSIRVRLLHAAVRQRILRLTRHNPGYYSVKEYGVPINDLDCIATIGTFSGTLIWLSFPRQGIWLREKEIEDYIALFRYIAYLTGTPDEFFATPTRAKTIMETLLRDEINPSKTSQILANNILSCLEVIVEDKHGLGQETVFDFKYIPALSKTTKAEKGVGGPARSSGIEKRNLRAFLLGCILLSTVIWVGLRIVVIAWRGIAILLNLYGKAYKEHIT
ncbi:MAG: hypothetical protein Q9181_001043 [Wetmoreana brouardii]